ncbi:MAG: fluoride efflux transporter FluC [Candidatus Hydrogenedentota bacterium]
MALNMFFVGLAGAAGAMSRYAISLLMRHYTAQSLLWPTFAANMLGCFLFGAFVSLVEHRIPVNDVVRVAVLVGFMGSLTTFSTFAFDSALYIREGQWGLVALNLLVQNVLGLALLLLGLAVFRPH